MNAETRANALLSDLFESGLMTDVDGNLQASVDIIAAAITRAQNDKLEEAARVVTEARDKLEIASKGDPQFSQVATLIVGFADAFIADIGNLKSKD